mgnify:CR=1 FL=1
MVRKVLSSVAVAAAFLAGGCSGIGFSETGSELTADDEHNTVGAEGAASEPTDVASEAEPHSSNPESTESLLPPLGKPDVMNFGFELFQPCSEITVEEFEAAGLGRPYDLSGHTICQFAQGDGPDALVTITSFQMTAEDLVEISRVNGEVEGIPTYKEDREIVSTCAAYLETTGGTIMLDKAILADGASSNECEGAVSDIKKLAGDHA